MEGALNSPGDFNALDLGDILAAHSRMIVMSVICSVPDCVEADKVIVAFGDLLKDSLEHNWDEQRTIIASHAN